MTSMASFMPDRRTWVVGFGITLGNTAQSGIPWIVGGLVESAHLDIQQASLMVTVEVLTMGCVMLGASAFVHRLPKKAVLVLATLLAIAAQVASIYVTQLGALAVVRAVSGLGFGLVYSLASAIGAGAESPQRTYGAAGTIALLLGVLINPMLGYGMQTYGSAGVFGGIVILAVVLAIPLFLISFKSFQASPLVTNTAVAGQVKLTDRLDMLSAAGVVLTMALMSAAVSGLYVFLERIARSVGLEGTALGAGMSVVSLIGASGGVIAIAVSKRVGNVLPLMIGLPLVGLIVLSLTVAKTQPQFWTAFTLLCVMFWFLYPFIFGLAARVDPKGRVASATGSGKILLASVGTALAGFLGANYGIQSYGYAAIGICLLSAATAAWVVARLKESRATCISPPETA
ncbi:MAG TPA: MFS transporter [Paraburkholderia sp.]|uniref:MFS transporter n=1 Tax=Paraburkholderia sp. TaxID=1926495 RepID=UPI002ED2DC46